jgi:hypothetical protein
MIKYFILFFLFTAMWLLCLPALVSSYHEIFAEDTPFLRASIAANTFAFIGGTAILVSAMLARILLVFIQDSVQYRKVKFYLEREKCSNNP